MATAFIHESSFLDEDVLVGDDSKIWHFCHVSRRARIGKRCVFGQNVFVGEDVSVGDDVKAQNNVSIFTGTVIADKVFLGPGCVFTNVRNPRANVSRKQEYERTLVQQGVTIGANATILCGITIQEYALVGAGSVVTHDIPAYALVYGNPAVQKGWACQCGECLPETDSDLAACPRCQAFYRITATGLQREP